MSKVVAMAHAPQETFDPLLPVDVALPYPGKWGQITAYYSATAVYDLTGGYYDLLGDLQPAIDQANADARSDDRATVQAALAKGRALDRESYLRILGKVLVRFEWPFAGNPPDPADPAAFAQWPDGVLQWLATKGLQEAKRRVEDPLSWNASALT